MTITYSKCLVLIAQFFVVACSSSPRTLIDPLYGELACNSSECEVTRYETILSVLSKAENELQNGNSFNALNKLEVIKEHAYYHGKFKSLYKISTDTCIRSTNLLSTVKQMCSTVRERVRLLKVLSPERINEVSQAVKNCSIDLSSNVASFDLSKLDKKIELSIAETKGLNLYDTIQDLKAKYNNDPWEKLLFIDLKILSGYQFKFEKPKLTKEMPLKNSARFIIPVSIKFAGEKDSYCSQYKAVLHDESFSRKRNCFDYPNASDFITRNPPVLWTNETYLTEIQVTNVTDSSLREIPFTKDYANPLTLGITYGAKQALWEDLHVEYPGDYIPRNLLARMAYTQSFENKVKKPYAPEIIINAQSRAHGIALSLRHSRYFGFEVVLDVPVDLIKDMEEFSLRIPVKSIHDHYHFAKSASP